MRSIMSTSEERLALIRVKVGRAKRHIRNLDLAIRAFINSNPYEVGTRTDPQTPDSTIYYIVSLRETHSAIPAIVGDVLFNLRAALDHLAYHLAWINGTRDEKVLKTTYFPISDDSTKYKAEAPGKVKGMSDAARKAIDACNPYKGGNDTLWRLHKLNNIDKHRFLVTTGLSLGAISANTVLPRGMIHIYPSSRGIESRHIAPTELFLIPENPMPLNVGDILFTDPSGAEVNQKVQFKFDVAFSEPGIAERERLLPTLVGMADCVDDLIAGFRPLLA